jgi:hypothetical protein
MENKEIIKEIEKRYNEALEKMPKSYDYDITKENNKIFIKINGKEHSITRQALADKSDGVGDKLADEIWSWIHP